MDECRLQLGLRQLWGGGRLGRAPTAAVGGEQQRGGIGVHLGRPGSRFYALQHNEPDTTDPVDAGHQFYYAEQRPGANHPADEPSSGVLSSAGALRKVEPSGPRCSACRLVQGADDVTAWTRQIDVRLRCLLRFCLVTVSAKVLQLGAVSCSWKELGLS